MSIVSADSLQLAIVAEVVSGVTPPTPAFDLVRTTGETLTFSPQTSESGEIGGGGRFRKPSNVTGQSISGDISLEIAPADWLTEAISGVLASNWGECPLTGTTGGAIDSAERITVGKDLQTYTIEKRFPNPGATVGAVPTAIAAGTTGSQTLDLTVSGGATTGSGIAAVTFTTGGIEYTYETAFSPGDDETAVAAALAAKIAVDFPATAAAAGVVTIDVGAGNVIDTVSAQAGSDAYVYQRYIGATFSAFSVNITPNSPVTGSFSIIGGSPKLSSLPIDGATYVAAGNSPIFTAPKVIELTVGGMTVGTRCWTSVTINLDSQNRGIPCIGSDGDREVVLGTLNASMSGELYFSGDQSVLEAMLNNETIGDAVITLSNADADILRFDLFQVKPIAGQLSAGGTGQDLTIPLTLEPAPVKVCTDTGEDWTSGLIISTNNTAPTLP